MGRLLLVLGGILATCLLASLGIAYCASLGAEWSWTVIVPIVLGVGLSASLGLFLVRGTR